MKQVQMTKLPVYSFETAEAINQLRVNLSFTDQDCRAVVVTSSLPDEGKSFVSVALWRALSEVGKKTLLIDCDLRLSKLMERYGIIAETPLIGVSHVLSGQNEWQDAVYETDVINGCIMPVTSIVTNPSILLESRRLGRMIEEAKKQFDLILIDTPPIISVADALTVCKNADASIMTVRSGKTKKSVVKDCIKRLQMTGKPVLGVVLNRVDTGTHHYGYYYYGYRNNPYISEEKK